jgi:hypothetical protein
MEISLSGEMPCIGTIFPIVLSDIPISVWSRLRSPLAQSRGAASSRFIRTSAITLIDCVVTCRLLMRRRWPIRPAQRSMDHRSPACSPSSISATSASARPGMAAAEPFVWTANQILSTLLGSIVSGAGYLPYASVVVHGVAQGLGPDRQTLGLFFASSASYRSVQAALPAQQLRQLGEIRRHPSRLVLGEQVRR